MISLHLYFYNICCPLGTKEGKNGKFRENLCFFYNIGPEPSRPVKIQWFSLVNPCSGNVYLLVLLKMFFPLIKAKKYFVTTKRWTLPKNLEFTTLKHCNFMGQYIKSVFDLPYSVSYIIISINFMIIYLNFCSTEGVFIVE